MRWASGVSGIRTARSAIRWRFVEIASEPEHSVICPSNGSIARQTPSLQRVARGGFPAFLGTMGRSDSLPPVRSRSGLPSPGRTT